MNRKSVVILMYLLGGFVNMTYSSTRQTFFASARFIECTPSSSTSNHYIADPYAIMGNVEAEKYAE